MIDTNSPIVRLISSVKDLNSISAMDFFSIAQRVSETCQSISIESLAGSQIDAHIGTILGIIGVDKNALYGRAYIDKYNLISGILKEL